MTYILIKLGFGSKSRTLAEAREKDKTITMGDINEFFGKKTLSKREEPVGQNSFIAPHSASWISDGCVFL